MKPSLEQKYFTGRNITIDVTQNTNVPSSRVLQTEFSLNTITSSDEKHPNRAAIHYHTFKKLDIWYGIQSNESNGHYLGQPSYSLITNCAPLPNKALGGFYDNLRVLDAEWGQVERRSLDKLLDRIRNTKSNLTVDLLEGGQAVHMIRKTIALRKMFVEFCANVVTQRGYRMIGKRRQAQRRLDYASNKWLELQYGWKPLMHSIYDAADSMRKARVAGPILIHERASNRKKQVFTAGYGSHLDTKVTKTVEGSYRCERGAYYNSPNISYTDFFSLNPLGVAWELVPYSFCVDWVYDIGTCLNNWETWSRYRSGYRNGYLTYTTLEERFGTEYGITTTPEQYWPNGMIKDGTGTRTVIKNIGRCVYKYKERNIVPQLPLPYGPELKLNLGSNQVLSAAALMRQRLIK